MEKVNIIFIYPADPLGPKVGGVETFIKGFIKNSPQDFNVEFIGISSNRNERPPKKWMRLNIESKEFNFYPLFFEKDENKKTLIPLSLRFTLALKFSQVDFSDRVLFFNRIEPAVLFKKEKSPRFVIIHNDIQQQIEKGKSEVLWSRFPWLYFAFEKFLFASLDHICTVSKNSLEFYQSKYPDQREKFSFLPTWVDPDVFYPTGEPKIAIREKLCCVNKFLPIKKEWILFVGRLQEQKAPIRLIDSFFEYHKISSMACLIIIGEGNLIRDIEKHVKKLNIENNVFLVGNMGQEMLADFYRASDVLLLTSNFEGMPRCVLEALGCGLPVVSTDVGEVKRVVKNGFSGEVVEDFSPMTILKGIEKVLDNPNRYSKNNCLKTVSEYHPQIVLQPVFERIKNS